MIKIEIKSLFGAILFSYEKENNTLAQTVTEAIKQNADLRSADLTSANLRSADLTSADLTSADLRYANLTSANLTSADLTSADLRYADLRYANLRSADLRYADLTSADLRSANLTSADLTSANLTSANLRYANLRYANLTSADLTSADLRSADLTYANLPSANLTSADLRSIRQDFWDVLLHGAKEIKSLKSAIIEGRIKGSAYEGECACLFGTLEKTKDELLRKRLHDLRDTNRPIERFFLGLKEGDTPENSHISKIVLEWLEEFEMLLELPK